MPAFEIISLFVLGAIAWLWFDSVKVRSIAVGKAKAVCAAAEFQLLDDTVSISSLKFARNEDGRLLLRRIYSFEYSDTGDNRRPGSIVMLGPEVQLVKVDSGA
jgi:hypothetical protein